MHVNVAQGKTQQRIWEGTDACQSHGSATKIRCFLNPLLCFCLLQRDTHGLQPLFQQ